MAAVIEDDSELYFFLVDEDGNRRVPCKVQAQHGPYGYALHPPAEGNDPKAARYTEDPVELIEGVVLEGLGVRTKAKRGPQSGRLNTLYLGERTAASYYLSRKYFDLVRGARIRPMNEVGE